jgi:hypothetical protein
MPARGAHHPPARPAEPAAEAGPQTAPHDQLVDVVRELADHAPNGAVLIDTLARALKERGFSRPPGSPRLITRLRRIRELVVSRTGMITLADAGGAAAAAVAAEAIEEAEPTAEGVEVEEVDGNVAPVAVGAGAGPSAEGARRRGRRRRRRRRRGPGGAGGGAPATPPA